jgi:hypothetical protein
MTTGTRPSALDDSPSADAGGLAILAQPLRWRRRCRKCKALRPNDHQRATALRIQFGEFCLDHASSTTEIDDLAFGIASY